MINRRESHKGAFPPVLLLGRLTNIYKALNSDVYGQDECKKQILSGMYRLTTGATNKPVILTGSPKKMNKHYWERFHVDVATAAKDLQELGVNYTQEQLDRIKRAEEQRLRQRRMEREAKERKRLAALYDPKTDVPPDVAKIEFVLSMLDKLIDENGHLQPEDRSLIAASLKNIYKPLVASGYTAPCPTLDDLYRDLNKSNLRRAKQLALMLDVFANGSLQAFSHTTNVDMNNRLICFNIQSLGDQLRPIAMMSLLEFINMQVMTNRRKDATAATWIYFDEIHVLLKDPMSSNFLYSSWKRFRKYNAYATGISQDIQDYLDNPVAYALLSNSEFVIMLRQSKSLEALERLYGLSKPQLEFLCNASEGHGIIKMGNSMIPFSNLEPKDTAVYKLITTKPGEATAEK